MQLRTESERAEDGRWLAEVPQLPGVLAYGASPEQALAKAQVLPLHVPEERIEHGEKIGPRMLSRLAKRTGLKPEDL
jgi:predicted RNase H-like HicB family nuclease